MNFSKILAILLCQGSIYAEHDIKINFRSLMYVGTVNNTCCVHVKNISENNSVQISTTFIGEYFMILPKGLCKSINKIWLRSRRRREIGCRLEEKIPPRNKNSIILSNKECLRAVLRVKVALSNGFILKFEQDYYKVFTSILRC